jgi:hypothetical protein
MTIDRLEWRQIINRVFQAAMLFRVPVLLWLLVFVVFLTGQLKSLTSLGAALSHPNTFLFSWVGATLFALSSYVSVLVLTRGVQGIHSYYELEGLPSKRVAQFARMAGLLILLAHYLAWSFERSGIGDSVFALSWRNTGAFAVSAALMLAASFGLDAVIQRTPLGVSASSGKLILWGGLMFGLTTLAACVWDATFANVVGTQFLIFVWAASVMLFWSGAQRFFDLLSIPMFLAMLLYWSVASFLTFGANHPIPRYAGPEAIGAEKIEDRELGAAFADWLVCRPGLRDFNRAGRAYPVFVIAAEGGGAYAAALTSAALAEIHETFPKFSNHVFAISGVSGGSIGAASFLSALLDEGIASPLAKCRDGVKVGQPGVVKARLQKFAEADLLSPLIAGTLFPGLLQQFSPIALPTLDRAIWFEKGLKRGWQLTSGSGPSTAASSAALANPFSRELFALWKSSGNLPALIANATNSETGFPVIVSPFTSISRGDPKQPAIGVGQVHIVPMSDYLKVDSSFSESRISLASAVSVSARFLYIFPSATVNLGSTQQPYILEFVDGGYYDNTGLVAAALVRDLTTVPVLKQRVRDKIVKENAARQDAIPVDTDLARVDYDVYLIVIGSFMLPAPRGRANWFNDIRDPIESIINTRHTRAIDSHTMLRARRLKHVTFQLNPDRKAFPLGLHLTSAVVDEIRSRVGSADKCPTNTEELLRGLEESDGKVLKSRDEIVHHNSCATKTVGALLN